MKRSCAYSGTVLDDDYVPWHFPEGLPVVACKYCGARRKLRLQDHAVRGNGGMKIQRAIYPYHRRVPKKSQPGPIQFQRGWPR